MADTTGDIIGRNYRAGRGIGNDFATTRFNRRAAKLREEYEARAKEEGKPLDDYLPEIQQRLQDLAVDTGVTRRAIRDDGGRSLDAAYTDELRGYAVRNADVEAGRMAYGGDQAGARQRRALARYNAGQFDDGQTQQIMGDTMGATAGALRPDGTYDPAKGAQALAGVSARYGDHASASQNQQGAETFRLKAANAIAGNLLRMVQNPNVYDADQIVGTFAGMKEYLPELGVDLQASVDDPDTLNIVDAKGRVSGTFNLQNKEDQTQMLEMLATFTQDPATALQQYMGGRLEQAKAQAEQRAKSAEAFRNARIKAVEDLTYEGVSAELANSLVESSAAGSQNKGWQLQDITEPGKYLVRVNGQTYVVATNVAPDPARGIVGGDIVVTDADDNPVPASVLNGVDQQHMRQTLLTVTGQLAAGNNVMQLDLLRTKLDALNALEAAEAGYGGEPSTGSPQAGAAAPRAGGVAAPASGQLDVAATADALYEAFPGATITSGKRTADRNARVGGVSNSYHLTGEALDIRPASPEQKTEIIQWAKQNGWEVHANYDDGHVHLEPPKRGMAINPVDSVESLQRPGGAAAPSTASAPAPGQRGAINPAGVEQAPPAKPSGPTPESARAVAARIRKAGEELEQLDEALARIERDYPPQRSMSASRAGMLLGTPAQTTGTLRGAPEEVQALYNELRTRRQQLENQRTALAAEARQQAGALNSARRTNDARAKYDVPVTPGVADALSRLPK